MVNLFDENIYGLTQNIYDEIHRTAYNDQCIREYSGSIDKLGDTVKMFYYRGEEQEPEYFDLTIDKKIKSSHWKKVVIRLKELHPEKWLYFAGQMISKTEFIYGIKTV